MRVSGIQLNEETSSTVSETEVMTILALVNDAFFKNIEGSPKFF